MKLQDKLQELANETASAEELASDRIQIIVFRLGEEEYALEIDKVKEVVLTPPMTKVPLQPDYIAGVANIRGNILAMVDLAQKFDRGVASRHSNGEESYSLVLENKDYQMAILVHQIPDTISVAQDEIDDSPNIVQEFSGNYIKGVIRQEERLIILLDVFRAIEEEVPLIC